MRTNLTTRFIAEALGTFGLVTLICGVLLSGQGALAAGIGGGLILMAMVYALGNISGAHFNPAVSLAAAISNRITYNQMGYYWVAQLVGAFLAISVSQFLFATSAISLAVSTPAFGVDGTTAITAEALATFFLAFTVLATTSNNSYSTAFAGAAIGSAIVLATLLAGPISGGSVNPARSLAPAIISGDMANIAIYLVGPAIGAIAAGLVTNFLYGSQNASSSSSMNSGNSNANQQNRRAA